MVNKLIILGIDGMDRDVILRYREHLPNLYGMMQAQGLPRLRSVFPADTTPAWATIYTGLDPSEHGIINFVNVGAKENAYKPEVFDDSFYKGKAFWDQLNQKGYSCAVILPMNIKEGWDIDGIMITRPQDGKMRVYPQSKTSLYCPKAEILGTEGKFTSESALPELRKEFFAKAEEEIRLTRMVMENEDVDVLFSYFSTTDGIQHEFWRHCDPTHPEYPGTNEHENAIRDMYICMDRYIGEIAQAQPDTPLLVISDHGHGARPVYAVRINELLRRGGFLTPKGSAGTQKTTPKKAIKKAIKKFAVGFVKRVGLPKWALKVARKFPVWKSLFASSGDFDWGKTQAYLSDLSALKNYSYGGIRLNETVADKDAVADEIIAYLRDIQIEGEDRKLFEWIVRTNTFYHGLHLNKYPEIIFQMDERWGGEWELGSQVFERTGHVNIMSPGGHRWRTAVIAAKNLELSRSDYEMTDIYGLIMENAGKKEA
jgi:predicted AlkP superfamily phosphohydrolase/phosphomutase